MEKYESLELEILYIESDDIVTVSGGNMEPGWEDNEEEVVNP